MVMCWFAHTRILPPERWETGIPATKQKLLHSGKLIATDQALLQVGHDGNVFLSIGLCGGAGECDICFSVGEFTCPECNNQVTCKVCCERVRKHPQRVQHQPVPTGIQVPQEEEIQASESDESHKLLDTSTDEDFWSSSSFTNHDPSPAFPFFFL